LLLFFSRNGGVEKGTKERNSILQILSKLSRLSFFSGTNLSQLSGSTEENSGAAQSEAAKAPAEKSGLCQNRATTWKKLLLLQIRQASPSL
jgi:hypothetical protein